MRRAGGSKAYPNISADFLGDWREEVVLFCKTDSASINVFSTPEKTAIRVPCLMHDHTYRMAIAWQNVAYNQPPHIGYFLPDSIGTRVTMTAGTMDYEYFFGENVDISGTAVRCSNYKPARTMVDGSVKGWTGLPMASSNYGGLTYSFDTNTGAFSITGTPKTAGLYQIVMKSTDNPLGIERQDTISINVKELTRIDEVQDSRLMTHDPIYNLAGQRVDADYKGIIIRGRKKYINN